MPVIARQGRALWKRYMLELLLGQDQTQYADALGVLKAKVVAVPTQDSPAPFRGI